MSRIVRVTYKLLNQRSAQETLTHYWNLPRKGRLLDLFSSLYPEPASELRFSNEYELLVAVLLSAQCTDKKVNEVTPALFSRYPTFKKLASGNLNSIMGLIRQVNYFRTKARHLRETARIVTENFAGEVPRSHELLTTLPGVGRKTANVILSELEAAHALPVDTHVFRVSKRLGLTKGKNVREVEDDLCAQFKPPLWRPLHHFLILHGRRICKAQRPLCEECALNTLCPTGIKNLASK